MAKREPKVHLKDGIDKDACGFASWPPGEFMVAMGWRKGPIPPTPKVTSVHKDVTCGHCKKLIKKIQSLPKAVTAG